MPPSRDSSSLQSTHRRPSIETLEGRMLLSFTPAGAALISGSGNQTVDSVATDSAGNMYAVGTISGITDFDRSRARTLALDPAHGTGYIAKYTAAGKPIWVHQISKAAPAALDVDAAGNVFVAGTYTGPVAEFGGRDGLSVLGASDNAPDTFVLRLNADGGFVAVNGFTVGDEMTVTGMELDRDGYIVLSAYAGSGLSNDPPRFGVIAKFDARMRNTYVHRLSGGASADTIGLATNPSDGGVYIIGLARNGTDLDPSAAGVARLGIASFYLLKLDSAGAYAWHTGYTFDEEFNVAAVAADGDGNATIVGSFKGTIDFNPSSRKTFALTAESSGNVFAATFAASGGLASGFRFGGTGGATASSVKVLGDEMVIGGTFLGTADFNPGPSKFELTSVGSSDSFLARFNRAGSFNEAMRYGNATGESAPVLALSSAGLVIGGTITGKPTPAGGAGVVDFDPGNGVLELTPRVNDSDGILVGYR